MTATARVLRRALIVALALTTGLAVFLLGPTGASAAGGGVPINIGAGFTTNPVGPLLSVTNIIPGGSTSGVMGVRNLSNASTDVDLQLINVHNDEHGCTRPEAVVDHSCDDPGPGEGELGSELVFTIEEADNPGGPFTQTWTGSAATLVAAATDVSATIPATSDRWFRVTAALPWASGNETQTDSFSFGIQVDLSGLGTIPVAAVAGTTASSSAPGTGTSTTPISTISNAGSGTSSNGVGGVSASNTGGGSGGHSGQSAGGGGLASTGTNVVLLTLIGALLLVSGFLLLQRRRGAREH